MPLGGSFAIETFASTLCLRGKFHLSEAGDMRIPQDGGNTRAYLGIRHK